MLLGQLKPYSGRAYSDIWGYAANGREYAILGVQHGTSIIDVTNPANPVQKAFIPGPNSIWREMKTHLHYAYVVTEGTGAGTGLQIIDLSELPDTARLVATNTTYFTTAHNITIENGYAYVVGTGNGGGMHILDLANPILPVRKSYYTQSGYIHDIYVYNDTVYASSDDTYDLIDVTNKSNPVRISMSSALPGIYAHSGWLTEDKRYFIAAEEFNVRDVTVWDLQDRTTWNLVVSQWQMPGDSPVHNIFVKGKYAHISYYKDGYVVLDLTNPLSPVRVGWYDTYPGNSGTYNGAWGVYPYLPSGNAIISDIQSGLFIVDFTLDNPLPVELTSFTAKFLNNQVILNWTTATELNNKGFELYSSENKIDWKYVDFIEGHGTTTSNRNYTYLDRNYTNDTKYYKLVQIDFDGTRNEQEPIQVLIDKTADFSFSIDQNFPNPFNPTTKLRFQLSTPDHISIKIFNATGELVKILTEKVFDAGSYEYEFNAENLPSGMYLASFEGSFGRRTIKMHLLK